MITSFVERKDDLLFEDVNRILFDSKLSNGTSLLLVIVSRVVVIVNIN